MEKIRVPHRRALAPLVGAGMAAVAAGSLVLFSLLAQEAALSPLAGDVVTPRERAADAGRTEITLPVPEDVGAGENEVDLSPAVSFLPRTSEDDTTAVAALGPTSDGGGSLSAVLALRMQMAATIEFSGPTARVVGRPNGPGGEAPGKQPDKDCPGRPNKDRGRREHPHGGPPACGNPHGAPPGYDKHDSVDPGSGAPGKKAGSGEGGGTNNEGHPHGGPPGRESTPPKRGTPSDPSHQDGGGNDPAPPGNHPHGGPPGHTKEEGSGGSGHPHGEPPGQAKKDK